MAHFDKSDAQFVVYFFSDKSLFTVPKSEIVDFIDDAGKANVLWKTKGISEDGRDIVVDTPFKANIVFSGSKYIVFIFAI